MRYLLIGWVGVVVAMLPGCGPSTTLTRGPFMDVSWAPGETQTASAGESIAWWQYGYRDSSLVMNPANMWSNTRGDTLVDAVIAQGIRVELRFNGFKDGQLVIRSREYYQSGSLQSHDDQWYARDNSDNVMYFDIARDSTVTVHGLPITVVSATSSSITFAIGGMPKRNDNMLPPPKRGSASR